MPAALVRLRIAGFKSFADAAAVELLPGLTGVVGPNGCGKSNVAEALRWAMGEGNARTLRGEGMDDVIFAGTALRPARNLAEVAITLEDSGGLLPPPLHAEHELHVVRRIERGGGSQYRVNGREMRARDVQTLFADLASGARASAMVSQGRVGALVSARPEERRQILEEAAGVAGLHSRRAEAETRLRAAEANLGRATDARAAREHELAGLRRQASQAARYRALSAQIRDAEAALLALQHGRAVAARADAIDALARARDATVRTATDTDCARGAAEATAGALAELHETEAAARIALERARLLHEGTSADAARAEAALADAARRRDQAARDLAHAEGQLAAAAAAEDRLTAEAGRLAAEAGGHPTRAEAVRIEAEEAAEQARAAETRASAAGETAAGLLAMHGAATQALAAAEARARRAAAEIERLHAERARAAAGLVEPARLAGAETALCCAEAQLATARDAAERTERTRAGAASAAAEAQGAQSRADAALARIEAEARALSDVLAVRDGEGWAPMVDQIEVAPGLEAALAAALGDGLGAGTDPAAARHWRALPAPSATEGTLADAVKAPPALARALAAIRLVESEAGEAGQAALAPGEALVSAAGALWRWDGYIVRAGAPTEAAVRLRQRNRLAALRERRAGAEREASALRSTRKQADAALAQASAAEQQARTARRAAEPGPERARAVLSAVRLQASQAELRVAALDDALVRLAPEQAEAEAALAAARAALHGLADPGAARAAAEQARAALGAARTRAAGTARAAEALVREGQAREARLSATAREREDWRMRAADARGRATDLRARSAEAEAAHAACLALPTAAAAHAAKAARAERDAEAGHRHAADQATRRSATADEAHRALRAAEAAHAAAREAELRAEAASDAARAALAVVQERTAERLGAGTLPPPPDDLSPEAEDAARQQLDRASREREGMGPVNLLAEAEAAELERLLAQSEAECAETSAGIAKLRAALSHINREGRERLAAVFTQVDRQFQALFTRMFRGGRAHLALVGSDDPLEAGLEIYAQPPGKKLASLSLLSGGEQALTALCLVFATFRCTPSPLCVLDEVDAPLDDANVERFCALLADLVQETGTRFLVVTHHALTMARMDRLYGVTMQERGVSTLLGVDLGAAQAFAGQERVAAE
jgi:chromosome segregation protein